MRIKPKVAWFSAAPGPEAGFSASAYVSEIYLPLLKQDFEIEVFGGSGMLGGQAVQPAAQALIAHREKAFDFFIFHVEDTPAAGEICRYAASIPGVVFFHDVLFRPGRARGEADDLHGTASGSVPYFCRTASGSALVALFAAARNKELFLSALSASGGPAAKACPPAAYYLPYPVSLRATAPVRTAPGLQPPRRRILFSGSPGLEHRAHHLLQALALAGSDWELIWLLDRGERAQAEALCREFGGVSVQLIEPRTAESWQSLVSGGGIASHLLFSAFGDPGPLSAVSMMCGAPVLVSDYSVGAQLPDSLVVKIPCGEGETEALAGVLRGLQTREAASGLADKAAQAKIFAGEQHRAEVLARELEWVLNSNLSLLRMRTKEWTGQFFSNA